MLKSQNYFFFLFLGLLFILTPITAQTESLGLFKQNDCVRLLQTCGNCTYSNVTSLVYPNSTIALTNVKMTKIGPEYNYTFCNTDALGEYIVNGLSDVDGIETVWAYDFEVTANGKEKPGAGVIVLFVLVFLIIIATFAYLTIYSLGHAVNLDFDIVDLAKNYGIYFSYLVALMLQNYYLGNNDIQNWLEWITYIGAFTNVFLPTVYLVLTLTVGSWLSKRVKGIDFA